jgi:hypothetical protein
MIILAVYKPTSHGFKLPTIMVIQVRFSVGGNTIHTVNIAQLGLLKKQ